MNTVIPGSGLASSRSWRMRPAMGSASSAASTSSSRAPLNADMNDPGAPIFPPASQAITQRAASARRGRRPGFVVRSRRRPSLAASKSAPRTRGWAASKAASRAASVWRDSSPMRSSGTASVRSARSGRVTTSPMPVRICGAASLKMASSASVCSARTA